MIEGLSAARAAQHQVRDGGRCHILSYCISAIIGDPCCVRAGGNLIWTPIHGGAPGAAEGVGPHNIRSLDGRAKKETQEAKQFFHNSSERPGMAKLLSKTKRKAP